jgi:hypothetical protein
MYLGSAFVPILANLFMGYDERQVPAPIAAIVEIVLEQNGTALRFRVDLSDWNDGGQGRS